MYEVFNMGCRMELYCPANEAEKMIGMAKEFGVEAQVIGRVEEGEKKQLFIRISGEEIIYIG